MIRCEEAIVEMGKEILPYAKSMLGLGDAEMESFSSELTKGVGYVVIDSLIHEMDPEVAQLTLAGLMTYYGDLSPTDKQQGRVVWPVTPQSSGYSYSTFSETDKEAQLHTDSQYRQKPEDVFCLGCICSDAAGKGTNLLLSSKKVIDAVSDIDKSLIELLSEEYPFRVPTVFTDSGKDDRPEVVWAPIITGPETIRFRADTVDAALDVPGVSISNDLAEALQILRDTVVDQQVEYLHLEPGQILLVDNWRILHGRTSFTNQSRLLYRVRAHRRTP